MSTPNPLTAGTVLVLNSGSSSIKFQLIDPETAEAPAHGLIERIGEPDGRIIFHHTTGTDEHLGEILVAAFTYYFHLF